MLRSPAKVKLNDCAGKIGVKVVDKPPKEQHDDHAGCRQAAVAAGSLLLSLFDVPKIKSDSDASSQGQAPRSKFLEVAIQYRACRGVCACMPGRPVMMLPGCANSVLPYSRLVRPCRA